VHLKVHERAGGGANDGMSRPRGDHAREGGLVVRYRARVEYDGTDFAGFQVQPGRRTVQGILETTLEGLGNETSSRIDGAGRTDAGVHATGQVIAFSWGGRLEVDELGRALDALLPGDVAIRDLRRVPTDWKPRYAARYR
jgi:tRNA pseudouridine38-40 synthase